jgi:hypothetical protein
MGSTQETRAGWNGGVSYHQRAMNIWSGTPPHWATTRPAPWTCIQDEVQRLLGREDAVAGMVAAIQTHGELLRWHPHIHTLVTCGEFTPQGDFLELPLAFAGPDRRRKLPLGKWDLLAAAP